MELTSEVDFRAVSLVIRPEDNGYTACVIRTLEKVGALSDWQYLKDTPYPIDLFIRKEVYRHKHICSALGYLPPAERRYLLRNLEKRPVFRDWRNPTFTALFCPLGGRDEKDNHSDKT